MSIALENRIRALEIRVAELEHKLAAQNTQPPHPKLPIPPPPVLPVMKQGKQHHG